MGLKDDIKVLQNPGGNSTFTLGWGNPEPKKQVKKTEPKKEEKKEE